MCYYNKMVINPKYKRNQKNGGQVPPLRDKRIQYVPIGCGNCKECRKKKQREWMVRLMEDIKTNGGGKFITLTLSNESIKEIYNTTITKKDKKTGIKNEIPIANLTGYERDNAIATKAVRRFNERWRAEEGVAIRHWLITELGHKGTENIHLHGIIWPNLIGKWEDNWKKVERIWKYGFIWKGYWRNGQLENYVNAQTIMYTTKYVSKVDQKHKEYKGIILTSDGIGKKYIDTRGAGENMNELTETYKTSTGHEISLPIYWRNQLWTEDTREDKWIEKLDKQERWVDGVKYDISENEEQYKKAVQEARRKNIELGYGGKTNENRKEYEEQRRDIMMITRIKNTKYKKKKNKNQQMEPSAPNGNNRENNKEQQNPGKR